MSTWILLRGLTRGSGHWAGFPDTLKARLGDACLVTLDLPGNGALHHLRSPARIEAMTHWSIARLHALGVEPPWHLLAVSMGAMVAVDWAARAPHTLAGCVLINTSLRPFSRWTQRLRPSSHAGLLRAALLPMRPAAREAVILRLTSANPAAAAAVLPHWAALRQSQPVSLGNTLRQLLAAARYRAPAEPPAVPLLVLCSARDALVDPRCSAALAERWHSDSAMHPSAGHDLTLDDGPWVADQVARWLHRAGRAPGLDQVAVAVERRLAPGPRRERQNGMSSSMLSNPVAAFCGAGRAAACAAGRDAGAGRAAGALRSL